MNRLFKHIVNFLVIVPFPNALFGLSTNVLTLAHLCILIAFMVALMATHLDRVKIKVGLLVVYLLLLSLVIVNTIGGSLFAFTFSLRVLFAIIAGWFLVFWNSSSDAQEFVKTLKWILYSIGLVSVLIFIVHPPADGRMESLFDVHTSKYLFFAFVVIFAHQGLTYNRTSDYLALGFALLMLSLSLQRGVLMTTILFLVLAFRHKLLRKLTWVALIFIICFQIGVFDPLVKRVFYKTPSSWNVRDLISNINSSGRREFWTYLWKNEKVSFFGNGLGHSIEIGKSHFPGLNLVHNDFLWLLIDTGIFGLMILAIIVYYIFKSVSKQQDKTLKRAYLALLFSIPLVMFVDNFVFHVYIYFPILFGYFNLSVRDTNK